MTKWELMKMHTINDLADAYMVDMTSPSSWMVFADVVEHDLEKDAHDAYKNMLAEGLFEDGEVYGY